MNKDGLYLNNVWVATADNIAATFLSNDLTKPATLQSSYTNAFTLPDSIAIRKLMGNAEQLDSRSPWPYQIVRARVVLRGEQVFSGYADFMSFSNGWEISLYQEKRNLFERLDRSLRTLDLSFIDHQWNLYQINARAASTDGICYPMVDYGLLKDGVMPPDTIFPAVYVQTLISRALYEDGFTLVGDLPQDDIYKRLLLPFSESEPTSNDEQWKLDRYARITMDGPVDSIDRGTLGRGYWLDRIQPFNRDDIDDSGFSQGKLHPYNTTTYSYVCPEAMELDVLFFQQFKALCVTGGIELILTIERNGQKVASNRWEAGAGYNILFLRPDSLKLIQTIKCQKDDVVQARLEARRFTQTGAFRFEIYNTPETSFVEFTPSLTTAFGDVWKVSRNLPDITVLSLLKAIAYLYGGTWYVDPFRRQVSFLSLTAIARNTAKMVDWSNRLDTGTEPGWLPRLEPYGQNNRLTWKEIDETKKTGTTKNGVTLGYGDGLISVDAPGLDPDVPLFEMPFAASTNSDQYVSGYGNPVLIKLRSVSGSGDNLSITNQNTSPRLLLANWDVSVAVKSTQINDDGVTVEPVTVNLMGCWFGNRPDVMLTNDTNFNLCFSRLPINRGEECIIDRHYDGLKGVLRRMRVLTVQMHLKPTDIAQLDFSRPVRLKRVRVGSLVISDGLYYLNKVADYVDGHTCKVTLVAITPLIDPTIPVF